MKTLVIGIVGLIIAFLGYSSVSKAPAVVSPTPVAITETPSEKYPFGQGHIMPEANPNCGPEQVFKYATRIESKQDFLTFLKNNKIPEVELDNFKSFKLGEAYEKIKSAPVDWAKVSTEIKTENLDNHIVYLLEYNPFSCDGFELKMRDDGYVSIYGCCGK